LHHRQRVVQRAIEERALPSVTGVVDRDVDRNVSLAEPLNLTDVRRARISPTSALMPKGCCNTSKVGITPMRPSGAVANTIVIMEIDRTWKTDRVQRRAPGSALSIVSSRQEDVAF
jgi:hypothetical protein